MKNLLAPLLLLAATGTVAAQPVAWKPAEGHSQIPLWPGKPPNARAGPPETMEVGNDLIGGHTVVGIRNVSKPTMTVYAPSGRNTGAAVLVCPGGGYQELAMDLEGTEICDWLTSRGITAVLLKYRVPWSGPSWSDRLKRHVRTSRLSGTSPDVSA